MRGHRLAFGAALRAEWTKFRSVPGWLLAAALAGAVIVGVALGPAGHGSCGPAGSDRACTPALGPGGEEVSDRFFFVHRTLAGNGSITVRLASLTGLLPVLGSDRRKPARPVPAPAAGGGPTGPAADGPATRPGLAPWSKAGLLIKDGTRPGSTYAAVMLTGGHGLRMQYDYTGDIAGPPAPAATSAGATAGTPRWLRLTRAGAIVTGAASVDGTRWQTIGTVRLSGLPQTAQVGMFATSPQYSEEVHDFLLNGNSSAPSQVTGGFERLRLAGSWPDQPWAGRRIGGPDNSTPFETGSFAPTSDGFSVTGSGDIAPAVTGASGLGSSLAVTLAGSFLGLLVLVVLAVMAGTAEYRYGLIRTTLAAIPQRGSVLIAKATVLAATGGLVGTAAAALALALGQRNLRGNGLYLPPTPVGTQLRMALGTGAMLALSAVLALAIGALLRRSAVTVAVSVAVIVLPYFLSITLLPLDAADWLLRVTPAAAFAVQQSDVQYPQVDNVYSPVSGYFPLSPAAGLLVLCCWVAAALGLALVRLRRRDA